MGRRNHQGSSEHTAKKEKHIEGLALMRMNQYKSTCFRDRIRKVIIADIFCGSGKNYIEGNIVDGSPERLLNAMERAYNVKPNLFGYRGNDIIPIDITVWFSDISKASCASLQEYINFNHSEFFELTGIRPKIKTMAAVDAIAEIYEIMAKEPDTYLFLVIDPNGPSVFPKDEIVSFILDYSSRMDIIPYISATAIKRCIGARASGTRFNQGWLNSIENLDSDFFYQIAIGRPSWIRAPLSGDSQQWTMAPSFGRLEPRNDWKKQGLVNINSEEGRAIIRHYTGESK